MKKSLQQKTHRAYGSVQIVLPMGDWGQQYQAEPAPARCLNEVPTWGPHGIPVNTFSRDALPMLMLV